MKVGTVSCCSLEPFQDIHHLEVCSSTMVGHRGDLVATYVTPLIARAEPAHLAGECLFPLSLLHGHVSLLEPQALLIKEDKLPS